jgi:hypothetical protein
MIATVRAALLRLPLAHLPSLRGLAAAAMVLAAAGLARADEVRLHDGRVLVGKVTKKNDGQLLEVETRDGVVAVAANEVSKLIPDTDLRTQLLAAAKAAGDTAFANLQLAMRARASGLEPEMWKHLDRALAQAAAGETTEGHQRRTAEFLAQLEPELLPRRYRSATTKVRIRQLLDRVHAGTSAGRLAAIEELLAREANADQDLRHEARRNSNPRQRIAALTALQRRELAGNDRFVLRTAILDGSEQVRTAAIAMSAASVRADDLEYMAAGLTHGNAKVRVRTADALGGLGKPEAMKWLVLAGPNAGAGLAASNDPNAIRGHIAILQQQAYIRDYDVEVAQAAFIADPKVDVLQSGTVLDVTVAGVVEERIIVRHYRQAIQRLSQQDPGEDPRKWSAWLANREAAPPAAAPTTPNR